jgi:hypothetical protein
MEEYRVQGEAPHICYYCNSRSDICNHWDRHLN